MLTIWFEEPVTESKCKTGAGIPLIVIDKETVREAESFTDALKTSGISHLTAVPTYLEALVPHLEGKCFCLCLLPETLEELVIPC